MIPQFSRAFLTQMLVSPLERVIYEAAFALESLSSIEEGST
jgi:hypothetical protein